MKYLIYDLETLSNCFIACFQDYETKKIKTFKVLDGYVDELKLLEQFIINRDKENYVYVGFNNLQFDAQILQYVIDNDFSVTANQIYLEAQRIINLEENKHKYLIPEYKLTIPQRDIYLIKHYNSEVKATSLKWLEFTFRMPNIVEMPIHHTQVITPDEMQMIVEYCENDIHTTYKAFEYFYNEVQSREIISKQFNINVYNSSEPRTIKSVYTKVIGDSLMINYDEWKTKQKEYVDSITEFSIDFPSYLNYNIDEFNMVKNRFISTVFNREDLKLDAELYDKGLISTSDISDNVDIFGDSFKVKKARNTNTTKPKSKIAFSYKFKNIEFVHGVGGLHACISPGIYESNDEWIIKDIDATSYYPFLGFSNNIYPPYLGEMFSKTWFSFFTERKKYDKKDPLNGMYKLFLNGTFGLLKEENSPIFYPYGFYFITLTGQLTLLYMINQIQNSLGDDYQIIQCNTDGITLRIKRNQEELLTQVIKQIEDTIKIGIESVDYDKMVIKDVNNYISVSSWNLIEEDEYLKLKKKLDPRLLKIENGNYYYKAIKQKGAFEIEMDKHKNPSFSIIPKAITEYFVHGIDYRDYVKNHKDIFDFCGAYKKKRNFDILSYKVEDGNIIIGKEQRVTRFFISNKPASLIKKYHDGRMSRIVSKFNVETLNDIIDINPNNYRINYNYYIKEIEKIINSIEGNKQQLNLCV